MKIKVETENCSHEKFYELEKWADSTITITIDYPRIVTTQSRKILINAAVNDIQTELIKFKWIISGPVLVDLTWYLNAVERQETDAVGDIDNISKPVQDALCGPRGLMFDDSQIAALYTRWLTRNHLLNDNVLVIEIRFNNDFALMKENMIFVQYHHAICLPLNVDFSSMKDMWAANMIIKARQRYRRLAVNVKIMGADIDNQFVQSNYDYHRTRLNGFGLHIISLKDFKKRCFESGFSFSNILTFLRNSPQKK